MGFVSRYVYSPCASSLQTWHLAYESLCWKETWDLSKTVQCWSWRVQWVHFVPYRQQLAWSQIGWLKRNRFEPVCLTSFLSPKVYRLKSLALRLFPKVKIKETFICLFFFSVWWEIFLFLFFFCPLQLLQHLSVSQFCVSASPFYVFLLLTGDNDSNPM